MTRLGRALAPLAAAALAGCPLPQPLPDYPAGTITPPRILVDEIASHGDPVVLVPADCDVPPAYPLTVKVYDTNVESFEARWFVNYHPAFNYTPAQQNEISPDPNPLVLERVVPPPSTTGEERPFSFHPYDHQPPIGTRMQADVLPPYKRAGVVRVVELVVSNGFNPDVDAPPAPLPNRTPKVSFETQVYRWVFVTVSESTGSCAPGSDPGCVKCP